MTLATSANYLVLDTETSGEDPKVHSPVEIGFVLTSMLGNVVFGESLVNPGHPITSGAKAIHHLLDEDVKDSPDLTTVLRGIGHAVLHDKQIDAYVAHYAVFDSAMLPMLNKKPWLCTYRLAKKLLPELPHHSNQFLRYELNLCVPEAKGLPAHRALSDAYVTAALLRHLLHLLSMRTDWPQELDEVIAKVNEPFLLTVCPFKKHKDKLWSEVARVDPNYITWLLTPKADQAPLDSDMAYSLNYWLKQRTS